MATDVKLGRPLAWDAFLEDKSRVEHIQRFWEMEWPQIRRQARADFQLDLTEMPHWVDSGKAVYWQCYILREIVEKKDADGKKYRELEDVDKGWQPTGPLPANNASVIARYLKKGFRLRPPTDEVVEYDVEALEAAEPTEAPEPQREYACNRQHYGIPNRGTHKFKTWTLYLQHCDRYGVPVEEAPPDDVIQRRLKSRWFCIVHDIAFEIKRMADRHIKSYLRRSKKHATVDQMEVVHADESRAGSREHVAEGSTGPAPIPAGAIAPGTQRDVPEGRGSI